MAKEKKKQESLEEMKGPLSSGNPFMDDLYARLEELKEKNLKLEDQKTRLAEALKSSVDQHKSAERRFEDLEKLVEELKQKALHALSQIKTLTATQTSSEKAWDLLRKISAEYAASSWKSSTGDRIREVLRVTME